MKNNFHDRLIELLKTDSRFVDDEGELVKAAVIDRAWKIDHDLIKLLLRKPEVKEKFFDEIEGHWVFNINTFIEYIGDKNFLANSYTRFRNKIGLNVDGKFLKERGEVCLVWPYKDCVLEGGQTKEEEKRKEIFFNEILAQDEIDQLFAPKVLTNWKRYTVNGEEDVTEIRRDDLGTIKENIVIKGNNLLALYTLKKQYRGKIDLIYIDPPYNPPSNSNTFCYNNTFNHSSWLTFMKNRLDIAKQLMTKNGVLIVAIDENENSYLGVLLDEIFPEHEKHCITIVHNPRGVQGKNFSYNHEYAIFVIPRGAKTIIDRKISQDEIEWSNLRNWGGESLRSDARNCFYPIFVDKETEKIIGFGEVCEDGIHPSGRNINRGNIVAVYPVDNTGVERKWRYARQTVESVQHLLRAKKKNGEWDIEIGKDFGAYKTVWIDKKYDANEYGTKIVKSLVPGSQFDFPKSLYTVYDCLYSVIGNKKDALVLDFFAGSGTTAHAVVLLNKQDRGERKFILVEQMYYAETVTTKRIKQAIIREKTEDDFLFVELKKYNSSYVDRINNCTTSKELLKLWKDIAENSFLNWYVNPEMPEDAVDDFIAIGKTENGLEKQKNLLMELLNKNQLYVNLSEIDDENFDVSEEDKKLNQSFYKENA